MAELNSRQQEILRLVVEAYVKHSAPIGSQHVVEMMAEPISSATIRSDMTTLTDMGLLAQPHTSAGRVPTELGFKHYVTQTLQAQRELSRHQQETLVAHLKKLKSLQEKFREAAKLLSEISGSVGVLIDDSNQVYMSGLSNLPKLPEFRDADFGEDFMGLLENPVQSLQPIAKDAGRRPQILLGSDNPFTGKASIVITKFGTNGKKIISVIGPVRMHYGKTLPAVEYITRILNEEI